MVAYGIDRRYAVNRKHIGHMWFDKDLTFVCSILELLNAFSGREAEPWILGFSGKDTYLSLSILAS